MRQNTPSDPRSNEADRNRVVRFARLNCLLCACSKAGRTSALTLSVVAGGIVGLMASHCLAQNGSDRPRLVIPSEAAIKIGPRIEPQPSAGDDRTVDARNAVEMRGAPGATREPAVRRAHSAEADGEVDFRRPQAAPIRHASPGDAGDDTSGLPSPLLAARPGQGADAADTPAPNRSSNARSPLMGEPTPATSSPPNQMRPSSSGEAPWGSDRRQAVDERGNVPLPADEPIAPERPADDEFARPSPKPSPLSRDGEPLPTPPAADSPNRTPAPDDKPLPASDDEPLRPIAETREGPARVEAASFSGITPGVTKLAEVEKIWGLPREMGKQDGLLIQRFKVDPFERVEVHYEGETVSAVMIRFAEAFPASGVAKQLELLDVRPVLVSNELGEILGQAFPERGVLFAFEPSVDDKPSMKVAQIILEPISAEPFVLRAETDLESRTKSASLDLEQALKLDPKNARAYWLYSRALASLGKINEAAAAAAEAVALAPNDPQFRVSRAQVLARQGKMVEAMQEAQRAVALAEKRPHVKARALCLLGDLSASGPSPNYRQALQLHTEAVKLADQWSEDKHPAIRVVAKEVLIDAHLGAAHDIAWGEWKDKEAAVPHWLERAAAAADDLIAREGAGEDQRFRVCTRALAACVGVRGGVDPTVWAKAVVHIGEKLIASTEDPSRQSQLRWDLGMALYDALQTFQMRNDHSSALKYGELAVQHLSAADPQRSPATEYLLGRLYFRLGAVYSLRQKDHRSAVAWFDKAVPLLEKPLPPEAATDVGRHGETFVSMGVSYWEIGKRDQAVRLTRRGVELMEQAVRQGVAETASLAVPYGNLSAMHRQLGAAEEANRYQTMAARARTSR